MNIFIETLGCPKNFNDTEVFAGILEENNHTIVAEPETADAIIVNTCGFINDAKTESIGKIFDYAAFEDKFLIVSGCLSQRYGNELFDEMPEVDAFLGVNDYDKLPEVLTELEKGERKIYVNEYENELETTSRKRMDTPYTATIKISEGCDNKCTYCIIPSIRGPYRSRPKELILQEAEKLASEGVKELILIAQDVTTYGIDIYGKYALHELVKDLCKIEQLKWIRLMYCYEDRITDELIQVMAEEEKVCKYLDIPIQHSEDSVLKAMKRRSTRNSIMSTVERLRAAMPDIAIRTTLIVGFPGETEEDFDGLYDFVEDTRFNRLGVFAYSQEEGTEAAEMENQIDEEIKEARKDAIMRQQMLISREHNEALVGKKLEVLIDGIDEEGAYLARTQYDAPEIDNLVIVNTDKEHQLGDFITVEIYDAYDYDIVGREI